MKATIIKKLRSAVFAAATGLTVRKSSWFAKITVSELMRALADEDQQIRVIRNALPDNDGHALIIGLIDENIGLKIVAAQAFKEFVPATDYPELLDRK